MAGRVTIGLCGIGEMGGALAREFVRAGHQVKAVLAGRSAESVERAAEAGISGAADLRDLAETADIVFSVVPPAMAEAVAEAMADAIRACGSASLFVEANAISPALFRIIEDLFSDTAARVVDGGLIGGPPGPDRRPRLYVSGSHWRRLEGLNGTGFDLVNLGGKGGEASAFKMTYGALTKGANALLMNVLLAADSQGFLDSYLAEIKASQPELAARAEIHGPRLPADAGRWIREMEEVTATFEAIGLPGGFGKGAAEIMGIVNRSPLGRETRRTRDRSRTLAGTVQLISASLSHAN